MKSKAAQLNEDGTFIFADYEFTAEEGLKDNAAAPISPNTNITITCTGGAVKLNGHIARAIDANPMPLEVGKRYLLFLKFILDTGAYKSFSSSRDDDTFQLSDKRLVQQVSESPQPFAGRRKVNKAAFMTEVRAALNSVCGN